jgi:hypothetical protein
MIDKVLQYKKMSQIKDLLTDENRKELQKVIDYCENKKINLHNTLTLVISFIKYNVPPDWVERIKKSRDVYKNDSSSLASHINRYGENIGSLLYEEKTKKCSITKENFLVNHTEEEWQSLCKRKISNNMQVLIEKYGEEEAINKKNAYLEKWKKSIKSKGGWDNGLSLKKLINKHGKEKGLQIWNEKKAKQKRRFSKEWYLEKCGEEGEQKWLEYIEHMKNLSFSGAEKRTNNKTFSGISQKLFFSILETLNLDKDKTYFHNNNGEKMIKKYIDGKYERYYMLDFCYENKIIEYDGEYWHTDTIKDQQRDLYLQSKGYETMRIKHSEYCKNPLQIMDKCISFLEQKND